MDPIRQSRCELPDCSSRRSLSAQSDHNMFMFASLFDIVVQGMLYRERRAAGPCLAALFLPAVNSVIAPLVLHLSITYCHVPAGANVMTRISRRPPEGLFDLYLLLADR